MILKQHNRSDYLCSSVLSTAGLISVLDHWNQSVSAPSDSKTWVSAERHDHLTSTSKELTVRAEQEVSAGFALLFVMNGKKQSRKCPR